MAVSDRMNDMLERYGEVCPQIKAAQILSVSPRTIMRMADDGACAGSARTSTCAPSAIILRMTRR